MKHYRLALACGVLLLAVATCGCSKLKARDQLNKGVAAYRNAQFQTAIDHFQQAVQLDPTLLNAKLYLATAYAQLYVPGGDSEENIKIANSAITQFSDVLQVDPSNTTAMANIGQIYFNMKKFDQAKEYQRRRIQVEPNNPEAYYWIGVLDWTDCFARAQGVRKDLNLDSPTDPKDPNSLPPIPEKARLALEEKNGPLVKDGIDALEKAIELRPNDFATMAYLNLMYRQKSEIEKDRAARAADLQRAEEWVQKAIDMRKSGGGAAPATSEAGAS